MIYFLMPTEGGPVKIGFSRDVDARRAQLEAHYGKPLALLATMPGGRDEERAIHERFAHLRFGHTEQFRPAADLMAFIGRPLLVGPNPEAVEAMPGRLKITEEAMRWARIASGYTGESMSEYVSRIVAEKAKQDADRLHTEARKEKGGPK